MRLQSSSSRCRVFLLQDIVVNKFGFLRNVFLELSVATADEREAAHNDDNAHNPEDEDTNGNIVFEEVLHWVTLLIPALTPEDSVENVLSIEGTSAVNVNCFVELQTFVNSAITLRQSRDCPLVPITDSN